MLVAVGPPQNYCLSPHRYALGPISRITGLFARQTPSGTNGSPNGQPGLAFKLAIPGSRRVRQLYSLMSSLVKVFYLVEGVPGPLSSNGMMMTIPCCITAAEASTDALLSSTWHHAVASSSSNSLEQLPSLVIIGRCCLLWAARLQQEIPAILQNNAAFAEMPKDSAEAWAEAEMALGPDTEKACGSCFQSSSKPAAVCCSWRFRVAAGWHQCCSTGSCWRQCSAAEAAGEADVGRTTGRTRHH